MKIEFELTSSSFIGQGHASKEADYIICWENDLTEEDLKNRANFTKVMAIQDYLQYAK